MSHEQTVKSVTVALDKYAHVFDTKLNGLEAKFQEFEQTALTGSTGGQMKTAKGNIARQVFKSNGFADIQNGRKDSGSISLDFDIKSTLTSLQGSGDSPQSGYDVPADRVGGLFGWGYRPLRLLDAMRIVPTSSNTVEYTRMNGFVNAAAAQNGEGVAKAKQAIDPQLIESRISTIAVTKKFSKQLLDDEAMMAAELGTLFYHLVRERLERDLVAGDGSNFTIAGLLELGSTYTAPTGATQPDAIGEMLASMDSEGYAPSFVAINPLDHQTNRSERSSTDNLYLAGSWAQPAPANYWNVPAILTPAVPQGSVIAVSNAHAAYLDRQSTEVRFFEQDGDNVEKNLVTCRAELRGGLMVGDTQGVRVLELP